MESIQKFLNHWPKTLLLMLIGALLGFHVWMFLPKTYTATGYLSVSIDYNRSGSLTELEQDRLIGITEDILHSDAVLENCFQKSGADDYRVFFEQTRISRTNGRWSLGIRGKDARKTGELALQWLTDARMALLNAREHALTAESLQNSLDGLTNCIQNAANNVPAAFCETDPEQLLPRIRALSEQIEQEMEASKGLSSAIQVGPYNPGEIRIRESSRSAAFDTLLGALCGLIAAFTSVWIPRKSGVKSA